MIALFQKILFRLRERGHHFYALWIRNCYWRMQGLKIGRSVLPRVNITWPHKIKIGNDCLFEQDIYFKHDGIWSSGYSIIIADNVFVGRGCEFNIRERIEVRENTLIASGCKFIDHDHGFSSLAVPMNIQEGVEKPIFISADVWIGAACTILKGVHIGTGAIVAAGSLVTKSIPAYEIWAGLPARKIGTRK